MPPVAAQAPASTPAAAAVERARPALAIAGVTKRWRKQQQPVLDDVDLFLEPGTITWLGGRNGIGKTTLLRIAGGLLAPDEGCVRAFDYYPDFDRRAYQSLIGFLSAGNGGLYARLTVAQHLDMWGKLLLMEPAARERAVGQSLVAFALEELADRRVDRMSLGQRQRVRLALAFLHNPMVALLDEPRNSLDEEGTAVLIGAVEGIRARGGAVLWCSPTGEHLDDVAFDERLVLADGKVGPA